MTSNITLDGLTIRELELLLASTIDQRQTAVAKWSSAVASEAPLSTTLPWAGAVNAAENRIDCINAELGRRRRGTAV